MTRFMLVAALLASLSAAGSTAAQSAPVEVRVDVEGVRSDSGRVLVALHDNRWDFPSRWQRAVAMASESARAGSLSLTLRLPRPGRYALVAVHDEDGDGVMKKSALGLPREGFATGRNAESLEFPFFDAALLDWAAGTRARVRILYP